MLFRRSAAAPGVGGLRQFADDITNVVAFRPPHTPALEQQKEPQPAAPPREGDVRLAGDIDQAAFEAALAGYARFIAGGNDKPNHEHIKYRQDGLLFEGMNFRFILPLSSRRMDFALNFDNCHFFAGIDARWTRLDSLSLKHCHLHGRLLGQAMIVSGGIDLSHTVSYSQIDLSTAQLQGDLILFRTHVYYEKAAASDPQIRRGAALYCGGLRVHSILMDNLVSRGRIFLDAAVLTGILKSSNGKLYRCKEPEPPGNDPWGHIVLSAVDTDIEGAVILGEESRAKLETPAKFLACGQVNISNSRIGGDLICSGGNFHSAYYLEREKTDAAEREKAHEALKRFGDKPDKDGKAKADPVVLAALNLSRTQIEGGVRLDHGFRAYGEVRFSSVNIRGVFRAAFDAEIDGALPHCDSAVNTATRYSANAALTLDRAQIGNTLQLKDDFRAFGVVSLRNAIVQGDIDCTNGTFHGCWPDPPDSDGQQPHALVMSGASVTGSVFLVAPRKIGADTKNAPAFRAYGQVRLRGTKIERNLHLGGGQFNVMNPPLNENPEKEDGQEPWIGWFHSARVEGTTFLKEEDRDPVHFGGSVSFRDMQTDGWEDDVMSWPQCDRRNAGKRAVMELNGLVYRSLRGPTEGKERLIWLLQQPYRDLSRPPKIQRGLLQWLFGQSLRSLPKTGIGFKTQPWEQCAAVLYDLGYRSDARLLYRMEQRFIRFKRRPSPEAAWNFLLGTFVGHGFRVLYALIWAILLVVFGMIVADAGYRDGYIGPAPVESIQQLCDGATVCAQQSAAVVASRNPQLCVGKTACTSNAAAAVSCAGNAACKPQDRHLSLVYPEFHPMLFSIDTALPAGNLHQVNYWIAIDEKVPDAAERPDATSPIVVKSNAAAGWVAAELSAFAGYLLPAGHRLGPTSDARWRLVDAILCAAFSALLLRVLYWWRIRREIVPRFQTKRDDLGKKGYSATRALALYRFVLDRERLRLVRYAPLVLFWLVGYVFFLVLSLYLTNRFIVFDLVTSSDEWLRLHSRITYVHLWCIAETFSGWVLVTALAVSLGSSVFHYRRERL